MEQLENDIKLGRFLCLVLRHYPEAAGITLDVHGWVYVGALLRGICDTGWQIDRETLEQIVRKDSKQRYIFNEDHSKIRANQGHSIQADVELRQVQSPQYLWPAIKSCVSVFGQSQDWLWEKGSAAGPSGKQDVQLTEHQVPILTPGMPVLHNTLILITYKTL